MGAWRRCRRGREPAQVYTLVSAAEHRGAHFLRGDTQPSRQGGFCGGVVTACSASAKEEEVVSRGGSAKAGGGGGGGWWYTERAVAIWWGASKGGRE